MDDIVGAKRSAAESHELSREALRKLDDLFDDKIKPRDVVVAEPELGLGPLHVPAHSRSHRFML